MINHDRTTPYVLATIAITFPIYFLYWVVTNFDVQSLFLLFCLSFALSCASSIFAHRAWTHKSWIPHPVINLIGLFIHTTALKGNSIGYVAVHRSHHRYTDTPKDPHSPFHKSWFNVQFLTFFADVKPQMAIDLIRDPVHVWFAKYYWYINTVWLACLYLIDPWLLSIWIAYVGQNLFKNFTVNSLMHNTPFWLFPINKVGGASNSIIHNILLFGNGESLHANHHADPGNWSFRKRWYEVDFGALIIYTFSLIGLATLTPNGRPNDQT